MGAVHRAPSARGPSAIAGAVALALSLSIAPSIASAEPSDVDRARATSLFKQARELMAAHRTSEACGLFDESERLDPGGGTLLNLALCREEEGKLATAWSEFQEARSMAVRDGRDDRRREADEHVRALEPRLSKLTVVVPGEVRVPGMVVTLDGGTLGAASWSTPFAIDGGDHAIEIVAPAKRRAVLRVHVEREGDVRSVTVPALEDAPPEHGGEARHRKLGARLVTGIVLMSAGAVELSAGTYFGVTALHDHGQSDDACYKGQCSKKAVDLEVDAQHAADAATALVTIGVASAALGVTLVLTRPSQPAAVSVGAGPSGIDVRGSF